MTDDKDDNGDDANDVEKNVVFDLGLCSCWMVPNKGNIIS